MSRIEELREKLSAWREAYYNLSPLVSDQEFDAARDELARLSPNDQEVIAIGASVPTHSVWEKVRHEIPMGSLNKANSRDEFQQWVDTTGVEEFFFTHKMDGSSMELVYQDGVLIRCVTRGDGIVGEDVTFNVAQVPNIPQKIGNSAPTIVRGEIVMEKAIFQEKYAEVYANPRNTAAAKVREKKNGGADCKNLKFYAYWIHSEVEHTTYSDMMSNLLELGFTIPGYSVGNVGTTFNQYEIVKANRDSVPYEIDGVVISVNDLRVLEELGDQHMRPNGQIAWKFDAAQMETRIRNVKWQVGPSGRITPVAVVDPVNIGGVVITNISLHNILLFENLRLCEGNRVLVSRRNDVIPYIEQNLDYGAA